MTFNQLSSINELMIYFGSRQDQEVCANFAFRNKVAFASNQVIELPLRSCGGGCSA